MIALAVDSILLCVVGYALALVFGDQFAQMGNHMDTWGHLVGFAVVLIYFGVLNSHIGKGKTLGKRLMRIRVVGENGRYLTLSRS